MKCTRNNKKIGELGEITTVNYYLNKGYILLFKNWRWSNKGEIDVIAYNKENDVLVICEVKTRRLDALIDGVYSVNKNKQNKIKLLASVFLQKYTMYKKSNIRFDVADLLYNIETDRIEKYKIIENSF